MGEVMDAKVDVMTQAAFAKAQGWSKAYVTQLKQAGRLVMQGKKVDVAASLALIAKTADPSKPSPKLAGQNNQGGQSTAGEVDGPQGGDVSFASAKATREKYLALSAKLAYERESGEVADTASIRKAAAALGVFLRSRLENMCGQLAGELASLDDADACHAVLRDHIHVVLGDMAKQLEDGELMKVVLDA